VGRLRARWELRVRVGYSPRPTHGRGARGAHLEVVHQRPVQEAAHVVPVRNRVLHLRPQWGPRLGLRAGILRGVLTCGRRRAALRCHARQAAPH
jgi:hypothetical protein